MGEAVTVEPVVLLNPVDGLHAYIFAPLAVRVVDCPKQIESLFAVILTLGKGLTVTVTTAELEQPFAFVPTTV